MTLKQYLERNPKKHIIFDFDKTIATMILPWEILRKDVRAIMAKYDKQLVEIYEGKSSLLLRNEIVKKYGDRAKREILECWDKFEYGELKGLKINHELVDFIKKHHGNYRFSVWSSNTERVLEKVLAQLGIRTLIGKLVTLNHVHLNKPHTDGFDLIFDRVNHDRKDYLMVGDSAHDEGAAKNCGIDFFKVGSWMDK